MLQGLHGITETETADEFLSECQFAAFAEKIVPSSRFALDVFGNLVCGEIVQQVVSVEFHADFFGFV